MRRWLPDAPDLGPFSFRPSAPDLRCMAHVPGEPGRIAFIAPGAPLPDGWLRGAPPPMDVEEWAELARSWAATTWG